MVTVGPPTRRRGEEERIILIFTFIFHPFFDLSRSEENSKSMPKGLKVPDDHAPLKAAKASEGIMV